MSKTAARPQAPGIIRSLASVVAIASLLAGQTGCLSTSVPPVGAEGASFKPTSDERRLWDQAKEEERKLRDKAALYQDPILEDYLNQVADRLAPPEVKGQEAIRIRVFAIKDPTLNAFTFPTGSIYVHTGLLARLARHAARLARAAGTAVLLAPLLPLLFVILVAIAGLPVLHRHALLPVGMFTGRGIVLRSGIFG